MPEHVRVAVARVRAGRAVGDPDPGHEAVVADDQGGHPALRRLAAEAVSVSRRGQRQQGDEREREDDSHAPLLPFRLGTHACDHRGILPVRACDRLRDTDRVARVRAPPAGWSRDRLHRAGTGVGIRRGRLVRLVAASRQPYRDADDARRRRRRAERAAAVRQRPAVGDRRDVGRSRRIDAAAPPTGVPVGPARGPCGAPRRRARLRLSRPAAVADPLLGVQHQRLPERRQPGPDRRRTDRRRRVLAGSGA